MLTAIDTFLKYLDGELVNDPPVYWWRQSARDEHQGLLKMDTLNVSFHDFREDGSFEKCTASLDLLGSDERAVLEQLERLRDVLLQQQFTLEYDYSSNPQNPVPTGRAITWPARRIRFINVRTPTGRYVHYNATFPLLYTRE